MPALISHHHVRAEQRRFRRAQEGRSWTVKDLPKFYYHKNFCDILDSVQTSLGHVLTPQVFKFLSKFGALNFEAQCAYVRMAGRKGKLFDVDRFRYPEISDLTRQYERLASAGLVSMVHANDCREFLESLTKPGLTMIMSEQLNAADFKASWKKDKLVNIAVDKLVFENITIPETIWVQQFVEIVDYIVFLHSGQIEGGLQKRTLHDLGVVKAPKSERLYGERFETAETAGTAWFYAKRLHEYNRASYPNTANFNNAIESWPAPICPKSHQDRDKLVLKIGRAIEQQGNLEQALEVYACSDSEFCNERTIRLRYKLGEHDWVQSRLESLIDNPNSDSEHLFARDFYERKFNKKRTSVVTDMLRDAKILSLDEAYKHQPETAAMRHIQSKGLKAMRTENGLWRTLFGLLFWDEIFGTGQGSPSSILKSCQFYELNKNSIEAKLSALTAPHETMVQLLKTLSRHYGTRQNIFRWGSRSLDRVSLLMKHSPDGALSNMLRLMTQNWNETKDGFPDLMLIEKEVCRFIEIKAPGDVIRRNQLTRLQQLKTAGYRADILKVDWSIDPNQTYVVVDVETTGGRPGLHRVTEIGAVKIRGGKIIDEWSSLINPQRSIPPNITRLTGITHDMVANAPIFPEIAKSFADFMGDSIFAAHNVNFDYGFIKAEFQMADRRFSHPKICTCASMRKLYPGHRSYSLKNLCRDFDIDLKSHHRALCDAKAAAELLRLINKRRLENPS